MEKTSFATNLAIVAFCAAVPMRSAMAIDPTGYVTLTATDGAGASSFNSAGHWSDGAAPAAGKKYLVNQAINLRTPQSSFSTPFAGDSLTLDNGPGLVLKSYSGSTISANYILHRATIAPVDSDRSITIGGTMRICGTQTGPSAISLGAARETVIVAAPLSGDETAFLSASSAYAGNLIAFTADNSEYHGRISFTDSNTSGSSARLRFSGATSVGVSGDSSASEPFLTIAAGSGRPLLELENVQMDTKFTIENNNANARIELMGTNVLFGATISGTAASIPVNVGCDALLQSASPLALAVSDGARFLARRSFDGTCDFSTIAEGSMLSLPDAKIPVRIDGVLPLTNATFTVTLLKIPTSVRIVTADDIDLDADDFGLMTRTISVESADGIQTVSATFAGNVVYYSVPNTASGWGNWAAYNQAAQYWSDNRAVHGDADYLVNYDVPAGCSFLRGCQQAFAGRSLTFANGGSLILKGSLSAPDIVGNLRMFPGSKIATGDSGENYNALSGGLSIVGEGDVAPVRFVNDSYGTLNLLVNLSGSGPVCFVSDKAVTVFPVVLSGDNGAFTGKMEFYGANAGRAFRVAVADGCCFGGNPEVFDSAGILFNGRMELVVTKDVAICGANRGITFSAVGATPEVRNPVDVLNVAAGATLTLDVPMVVDINLQKTGAGTLGIGGTITGAVSNITVSAGSIMPVTRQASSALRYTMAAGTGLAFALNAADTDVAADGLYVEDASHLLLSGAALPATIRGEIPIDGAAVKCGILNVPASMADAIATALGANATFTDTATGRTRTFPIERETLAGDRVRFFATVSKGPTVFILR